VNKSSTIRRADGFTLIELMIAMILGLIVIAGVTSVFLAGQQSFRTNNALADVQDSSRIAFELMARDIRQAGLTGCNSANDRVTNVFNDGPGNGGTSEWWADWSNMLHGYDDGASSDPALKGTTAVASDNSLELISAANPPVAIKDEVANSNFDLYAATTDLENGDLVMVCSPSQSTIMQVGYKTGSTDIAYDVSSGVSPGNCSTNLGYAVGPCPIGVDTAYPPNSMISKMTAVDWYIGTNKENGTSLYRVSLINKAGVPTPQAQEMVRNVTGMTITYLDPSNSTIATSFEPASKIDAVGGWLGVTAVNVKLTIESTFKRATVNGDKAISREYNFTTTVRNRVN
jgi:type IV pilus assembly protein PilW